MIGKEVLDNIADEKFRLICAEAVDIMNTHSIPGAVIGISDEDEEQYAAFGTTNIEHPLPVTEDTFFQIGSITKTYLATAVMRLVEMGKLDLDEPIRTYLPDLKLKDETVAQRVTMRHLLTHTGGWVGDYFDDFGMGEDALAKMVAKLADFEQLTPLGEVWSYSNSGFDLAGRVVEVICGQNFEEALKELVLDPLGLSMTFFFADDVITHRFVVGHEIVDNKPKVARPWAVPRCSHPAGGIICTVKDLLRYAHFHMGDGTTADETRLLSQESQELMQTPMFPAFGIYMIGLSWGITTINGTKILTHPGGTNGQLSTLNIVPSRKFAVAVLTNSDAGDSLYLEIANSALKHYLDLVYPEALPQDLPEEKLLPYIGKYDATAELFEIYLQDGELFLQLTFKGGFPLPDSPPPDSPPPRRIAFYAEDRIIVLDEPIKGYRGEFLRNTDNSIAWFRMGGRVHMRQP
jgi:CubicO group peptidase (beta-lactamase class C family)